MIEAPVVQPWQRMFNDFYCHREEYAMNFEVTFEQKKNLIEHANDALKRPLLQCWYRRQNGVLRYSTSPISDFLRWTNDGQKQFLDEVHKAEQLGTVTEQMVSELGRRSRSQGCELPGSFARRSNADLSRRSD
jgi:hypothetical protein